MRYLENGQSMAAPRGTSGFGGWMSSSDGGRAGFGGGTSSWSGSGYQTAGGPAMMAGGQMAGQTGRLELGQTTNPRDLVPGNPEAIRDQASALMAEAARVRSLASTLSSQNPSWDSSSAQDFLSRQATAQEGFNRHATTMEQAGASLESYAATLALAQQQAQDAINLFHQGQLADRAATSPWGVDTTQWGIPADSNLPGPMTAGSSDRQQAQTLLTEARAAANVSANQVITDTAKVDVSSSGTITITGPGAFPEENETGFSFVGSADLTDGSKQVEVFNAEYNSGSWKSWEGRVIDPGAGVLDSSGKFTLGEVTSDLQVNVPVNSKSGTPWHDLFGLEMKGSLHVDAARAQAKSSYEYGWLTLNGGIDARVGAHFEANGKADLRSAEGGLEAYLGKAKLAGGFDIGDFFTFEADGSMRLGPGYGRMGEAHWVDGRYVTSSVTKLGPLDLGLSMEFDPGKAWNAAFGSDPSFGNVVGGSDTVADYVGTVTVGNDVWAVHAGEGTDYGSQHIAGTGDVSVNDFASVDGPATWDSEFYSSDGEWIGPEDGGYGSSDFGGTDFGGSDFGDFGGSDFGDFGGSDFGGSDFGDFGGSDFGDFGGSDFGDFGGSDFGDFGSSNFGNEDSELFGSDWSDSGPTPWLTSI